MIEFEYLLPMVANYYGFLSIISNFLNVLVFFHLAYSIVNGRFGIQLHTTLSAPRHLVLSCFVFYFDAVEITVPARCMQSFNFKQILE